MSIPPEVRRWLYLTTTAALAVCGVYGLVTAEQAAAWAGLAAAVTALAAANTTDGSDEAPRRAR